MKSQMGFSFPSGQPRFTEDAGYHLNVCTHGLMVKDHCVRTVPPPLGAVEPLL